MSLVNLENKVKDLFYLASKRDDVETTKKLFSNYVYKYVIYTKCLVDLFFISAINDSEKIFNYMLRKKYHDDLIEKTISNLTKKLVLGGTIETIDKYIPKLSKKESLKKIVESQILESMKVLCINKNDSKIQLLLTNTFIKKSESVLEELSEWSSIQLKEGKNTTISFMYTLIEKNKLSNDIESIERYNIKQKLKL